MARHGYHYPVLLEEVLARLPTDMHTLVDGTLGHGGHTEAILTDAHHKKQSLTVVGVDRDAAMLEKAAARLGPWGDAVVYVQGSYADLSTIRQQSGRSPFDAILLDLGVNMEHFKDAERGFSIKQDGPLDMRFDITTGRSAREWLHGCTLLEFHTMLEQYTDFSEKRIAHLEQSFFGSNRDFLTTGALRQRAKSVGMNEKSLAVFFQAIRIVVNAELQQLALFLEQFPEMLSPGGRCIILTYHSGEDRMVKESFKQRADQGVCTILTKHVIAPKRAEKEKNPAARSAKMRVIERRN